MNTEEIELKEEDLVFIKSLENKLNVKEYSEIRNIIEKYMQLAKNKSWEAKKNEERYKSAKTNIDKGNKLYCEEKQEKEEWKTKYNEVCNRYAKLEIDYDLAKAKLEILEA